MDRIGVGVIGCGNISGIYLQNLRRFENLELIACADIDHVRAQAKAIEHGVEALSTDALIADPRISLVVNLTIPAAHYEVSRDVLKAKKHLYSEKPLALTFQEGSQLLELAEMKGVRSGCAPDTFLGGGLQKCRALIDEGRIGRITAGSAFMQCHGHEGWHPDPEFYYRPGGGPMLDMGPYYLTALVSLLGPAVRVSGMANRQLDVRTIGSGPKVGESFPVEVNTHTAGLIEFSSGAIITIVTSFDTWASSMPLMELHGTGGSMQLPDPNSFGGPIYVWNPTAPEWAEIDPFPEFTENSRGLGAADLASAVHHRIPARASGELALHVLEIMEAINTGATDVRLTTTVDRPARIQPGEFSLSQPR